MRIWFISPEYFDKKGLLAQWNEGNILKNIIVEKKKTGGWVHHPFSKRVLRYKTDLQRKIINTYLNALRNYGVEKHDIKFKEKYLEKEFIDEELKIPILAEHVESDFNDALFKMKVRDKQIYKKLQTLKKSDGYVKNLQLLKPYYLENNFQKYEALLSKTYKQECEENEYRLCGYEIPEELSDKYDKERGTNQRSVYKSENGGAKNNTNKVIHVNNDEEDTEKLIVVDEARKKVIAANEKKAKKKAENPTQSRNVSLKTIRVKSKTPKEGEKEGKNEEDVTIEVKKVSTRSKTKKQIKDIENIENPENSVTRSKTVRKVNPKKLKDEEENEIKKTSIGSTKSTRTGRSKTPKRKE